MNHRPVATALLCLLAVSAASGCGSDAPPPATHGRSVGQQLMDLNEAHRQGIISEREYKRLKKNVIKQND